MKKLSPKNRWQRMLLGATALALYASAVSLTAQISPATGDGSWDFTLSGFQRGVVHITFNDNGTLSGTQIIATPASFGSTNSSDNPRGSGDNESRTSVGSGGGGSTTITNYYGMMLALDGVWTFDASQRVIGIINEAENLAVSFRGVVRSGRMTMTGVREGRRITYTGVPRTNLPTLGSDFYAQGKRNGQPFTEIFTLLPAGTLGEPDLLPPGFINGYDVMGTGPGYTTLGAAILSARNQLAMVTMSTTIGSTNPALRSVVGNFRGSSQKGTLQGAAANGDKDDRVTLKVFPVGAP